MKCNILKSDIVHANGVIKDNRIVKMLTNPLHLFFGKFKIKYFRNYNGLTHSVRDVFFWFSQTQKSAVHQVE
jgi:hypothetical protein